MESALIIYFIIDLLQAVRYWIIAGAVFSLGLCLYEKFKLEKPFAMWNAIATFLALSISITFIRFLWYWLTGEQWANLP